MSTVIGVRHMPPPEHRPVMYERLYVWQIPVRIFHWVNAACITVLFSTGLLIAHPVFTETGEAWHVFTMARVRQIHFAAAFILVVVFLWRILWFWVGNKYARSGFPYVWRARWWRDLGQQAWGYLRLDFGRPHTGHNALAGLSYTIGVIGLGWLQILTGLAMYSESSPGGFWDRLVGWVVPLLGGSMRTLMWHDLFAWAFLCFVILHVYIVLLDSRQYRNGLIGSMITGNKFREITGEAEESES